jgi:hypothetical protein
MLPVTKLWVYTTAVIGIVTLQYSLATPAI